MAYLMGIDIGTSSVKTAIIDTDSAQIAASARQEYPLQTPQVGYAEQDPDDWWQATISTVRQAIQTIDVSAICGIGLSGQMHGTVCLDADAQPIRPAIIWADERSQPECQYLWNHLATNPDNIIIPGPPAPGFMATTMMWLSQHEPDTMKRLRTVILPKDYVRLRLTGQIATDNSDAAATWLFDIETAEWSDTLLTICGLERRYLPEVVDSSTVDGMLTTEAAIALGLPADIPVVMGCADQPAQALGYGLTDPGTVLVTIGTGGQVFQVQNHAQTDSKLRYYTFNHAVPGRWYAEATLLTGGLALRWLRDLLGVKDYDELTQRACQVPSGIDDLLFIPHLLGERKAEKSAYGGFMGLQLRHQVGHLARAVIEGITFAMKHCLDLIDPDQQAAIIVSGGATQSPFWLQLQADVYNRPLMTTNTQNHACIGAALVAGVGCGVYSSFTEAVALLLEPIISVEPDAMQAAFYQERFARYRKLYDLMHATRV